MLRGCSGFYSYAIYEHLKDWPDFDLGETRITFKLRKDKEMAEDGKELLFDHGAPYFSVSSPEVLSVVNEWESRNLCVEWKDNFGIFDCFSNQFSSIEQEGTSGRYVGTPGMNSICKALCHEPGVESKFGVSVGRMEWLEKDNSWLLLGMNGQNLDQFEGIVASDKNIVSPRFTSVTGKVPSLGKMYVGSPSIICC